MKKLLLSLVLAASCNLSFGQNVTDFTFTGMLAKTTYAQFSLNAGNNTIATAGGGWISAIAAPTVDVANITDMVLTINSGSTVITTPSPAGPVPTNYTGSILPVSGWVFSNTLYPFVYLKNTAGDRYRGVNIFIHKLVPTSVPYIVANSQQTTGFAHCGEVANTGGGTPQLHTNGQAIYLAFNSVADVVKFQYENLGTATADPDAVIVVEKSADLVSWSSIQSIDISNQILSVSGSGKVDVSYNLNDAAARYIRIRIDGLANSRSNRKEYIRSIAVQTKPVITWNQDLTGLKTLDSPVTLTAASTFSSASAPAATNITYTSSNEAVVSVVGDVLTVVGAGEATITAKQLANSYYAVAADVVQNVTVTASATAWTGGTSSDWTVATNWTNGVPTSISDVSIASGTNQPIIASNVTINSLAITSGNLTVNSGVNLTVIGAIANNGGTMTLASNANLIQGGTTNMNTGNITVNRDSNALKRLDYTLWSSPVTGSQTLAQFSSLTSQSPNRFYTYNPGTNVYDAITTPISTTFSAGSGFLIRMPNEGSANYNAGNETLVFSGQFTGIPNNGNISVTTSSPGFYAVGNPYPSTIDANTFLSLPGNSTDGTLYFWRKTNGVANTAGSSATGTAYATWTTFGAAASDVAPNNIVPNGTIQVGQGFIVKSTGASLSFTNAMRLGTVSTQFFKTKQLAEKSRVWLNLTNATGVFSQALVGYVDGATLGVDKGIDGKFIGDSAIALTSNINNEEYTIQGRPAFDASDIVALNFKTDAAGDYSIAIDHVDGLFAAGQDIYLADSKTGIETNLKEGAYNFTATAGVENSRFSLKYQKTLKIDAPAFKENSVSVYKNNGTLYVNSGSIAISNIRVFDVQGRLLFEQRNVKATTAIIKDLRASNQVLIVKIVGENNSEVIKKVLN